MPICSEFKTLDAVFLKELLVPNVFVLVFLATDKLSYSEFSYPRGLYDSSSSVK